MAEQKELYPNSFQVHNYYVDTFLHLLTGEEVKVLLYAIRRIHGFQKSNDRISLSQFVNGTKKENVALDCGTGLSKPTVIKALSSLKQFGLLVELETGSYKDNTATSYALQYQIDKVDIAALERRAETTKERHQGKTAKLREAKNRGVVNAIDVVNDINQGSKAHLPKVVNDINQGVVKAVDQTLSRRETQEEEKKKEIYKEKVSDSQQLNEQPSVVVSPSPDICSSENAACNLFNTPPEPQEQKPKRGKEKTQLTAFPERFTLEPEHILWAKKECPLVDWKLETQKLKDWALANGSRKADWIATWRNWLRRTQQDLSSKQKTFSRPTSVVI